MKPIFPRSLVMIALAGALLSAFGARADAPKPAVAPRPLAAIKADLAALDPYEPEFEMVVERLLSEQAAASIQTLSVTN